MTPGTYIDNTCIIANSENEPSIQNQDNNEDVLPDVEMSDDMASNYGDEPYNYGDEPYDYGDEPYREQGYIQDEEQRSYASLDVEHTTTTDKECEPERECSENNHVDEQSDSDLSFSDSDSDHEQFVSESDNNREQKDSDHQQDGQQHNASSPNTDVPLYPGATITLKVTMILLLTFVVRHNLSNEAISDLLYLIELICPKPNLCCTTVHKFKKYFSYLVTPVKLCYYCPTCFSELSAKDTVCSICNSIFQSAKDMAYFLHFSISTQIRALFSKQKFLAGLSHRFQRQKQHIDNYEDVYDGSLYKKLMSPGGVLESMNNLSLLWNVDGIPLFKSSKYSLWPMYFVINELPHRQRILKENCILAGLWFGEAKPNMGIYLKTIVKELITLENPGIVISSPFVPLPFLCKAILLAGSCDLPAKCLVLNSMQFNGNYGCNKCLQSGETFYTSEQGHGHTHVYLFNAMDPTGPKRNADLHEKDAREACQKDTVVNGIKGPSWLMKLQHHDIIAGTSIDYMHCTLLGVMKALLSLWFGTEHSRESYYIGKYVSLVDKRLKEIKPPSIISRKPRAISEHFKYYKASELRSFLLYYSLPVLFGILPPEYWNHFSLLSMSIYILLQPSISNVHLQFCQRSLMKFCHDFQNLYGYRYMSANVHLLLHLPDTVKELGPLWAYSCFHFEGLNGILKGLVRGTHQIDKQLTTSFSYLQHLPALADDFVHMKLYHQAFKRIHYQHNPADNRTTQCPNIQFLGKSFKNSVSASEQVILGCQDLSRVVKYLRIKIHGIPFYSYDWKRNATQRNNSALAYFVNNQIHYGIAKSFYHDTLCSSVYCVLTKLIPCDGPCDNTPHVSTFMPYNQASEIIAIPVEQILGPCVYISFASVKDYVYVAMLVNTLEKD